MEAQFKGLELSDLEVVATLGIGGFGRVELVRDWMAGDLDCKEVNPWSNCAAVTVGTAEERPGEVVRSEMPEEEAHSGDETGGARIQ